MRYAGAGLALLLGAALAGCGAGAGGADARAGGPAAATGPTAKPGPAATPAPTAEPGPAAETGAATAVRYDRASRRLDFSLPGTEGGTVTAAGLLGRPAVLNLYASWCGPCAVELPAFERVHQALGDRVAFLGVNPASHDSEAAARALIRATGVTYPTARDPADAVLRAFSPAGALPVTVFLDADGRVVDTHFGALTDASLRGAVASLLGVSA